MALIFPVLLAFFLVFIVSFWKTIQQILKFRKYDDKIPGPPTHPLFGNVATFKNKTTAEVSQIFRDTADECRKMGKNVMKYRILGKLYVWPLNGKAIAKVVESTTELNKGDDYEFFLPWLGGGVLVEGFGERWRTHRKLLTPTFHFAKLEGYLEVFNSESRILIECLEKYADSGATVDLFPYIKRCALDIICGAAMGTKVNAQFHHEHPYVKAVEGFNSLAIAHAINPYYQSDFIFWALGLKSQKDKFLNTMKTFTGGVIAERKAAIESGEVEKETSKRKMNFLDILLNSGESNMLSAEDIRQEVDTFMFAGHDTTTTSLSWMCWNMAHNPDIQEKVYEELVSIFGEDTNEDVTTENLNKLEYTERVLKESKRVIAPVPAVQRKLINDMEIDGITIPSGANIAIAPLALHANADVFPNPEKFDPDRFLPDEVSKRNSYDFMPFSAGLRNCIGQKFAQMNEKVMLIHILLNFKLEPMAEFKATKPMFEAVAKPSNGIPVKLTRRLI
uniref:Cytochrome P450 n=1 Tax=Caenorhabditis tropicalis TaxID=1561998 RepID=A0A1I7UF30_9PELO